MSSGAALPSLQTAPFLNDAAVRAVFAAIGTGGDEIRIVGGAVRDHLLGRPDKGEVDLATTALPEVVARRGVAAGMRAVPTGIEHGTVTLVANGRPFEVTTLREDVETDGRHAVVRFGRDWTADALRRDFTMNALSVSADGVLHDPAGGYDDILNHRIRFIGDADTRVAEDRLRLLRFFRFHAELGFDAFDPAALGAAIRARAGLRDLAPERIAQELRKLVVGPDAVRAVTMMADTGILTALLLIAYPAQFRRLAAFEAEAALQPSVTRRLAALGARIAEDVERMSARLRLSNAERSAIDIAVGAARRLDPPPSPEALHREAYRLGKDRLVDAIAQAAATGGLPVSAYVEALNGVRDWPVPQFPVRGEDLLAAGLRPGPAVGATLRQLEEWWIGKGFAPDRGAIVSRMQQMVASQQ